MSIIKLLFLYIILLIVIGCSYLEPLDNESPVDSEFYVYEKDSRILYKEGMKKQADILSIYLDSEVKKIEAIHGSPFIKKVTVHICNTIKCFSKYTYVNEKINAAVSVNGLFLSPIVFKGEHHQKYLSHELSHLHLFQQISLFRAYYIPQWFHDGLATLASSGGGATFVSKEKTYDYILNKKNIDPIDSVSILAGRWPLTYTPMSNHKFQQHMNYRQSSMFVKYLNKKKNISLLLKLIIEGNNFRSAFYTIYKASPNKVWLEFYSSLTGPNNKINETTKS